MGGPEPTDSTLTSVTIVQATNLALMERRLSDGSSALLVTDRTTGLPVQGATATLSFQDWQQGGWRFTPVATIQR